MNREKTGRRSPLRIPGAKCRAGLMGEWPQSGLDIEPPILAGWEPVPIREYVIKLASGCNLSCSYCYVYSSPDESWRAQPALMHRSVLAQTGARIAQHAENHKLRRVR